MEKDRRRGKRQGRNVVDDDHDESLNILGFAGGVRPRSQCRERTRVHPPATKHIVQDY